MPAMTVAMTLATTSAMPQTRRRLAPLAPRF